MALMKVALRSLPLYGGDGEEDSGGGTTTTITAPSTTPPPASSTTTPPAGGDSKPDPIEKLQNDPNALGQLLSQVDKLTKDLTKVTGERDSYVAKEQENTRKLQSREQQLETDLGERDAIIQQMDSVIRSMAINNAMLSQKDIQWHSVKQAMAELNADAFDIDIDLERGTADVSGIENEAKRIAKEFPWLVAKGGTEQPIPPSPRPRGSGAPPAPPGGDGNKAQRRSDLMKRFPVIASGRSPMG